MAQVSGIETAPDCWGSHWNNTLTASAAISDDKKTAVVHSNSTQAVSVRVKFSSGVGEVNATVLAAPSLWAVNTPSAQETVSPKPLEVVSGPAALEIVVPPHAFVVLTVAQLA